MSDPRHIPAKEAVTAAVEFVCACIGEAEADGFQQQDEANADSAFTRYERELDAQGECGFTVLLGGRRVRFRATLDRSYRP